MAADGQHFHYGGFHRTREGPAAALAVGLPRSSPSGLRPSRLPAPTASSAHLSSVPRCFADGFGQCSAARMPASPGKLKRHHIRGVNIMSMKRQTRKRQRVYRRGLATRIITFNIWFRYHLGGASHEDLQPDQRSGRVRLKGHAPDRDPIKSHPGKSLPKPLLTAKMRWRLPLTATAGTLGGSLRQFKLGHVDRLPMALRGLPPDQGIAWLFGK